MADHHGSFVWYELMTTDIPAAEAFYGEVMGWKAADSGMPGVKYTLFTSGDAQVAGGMGMPPGPAGAGMPPNWTGYVAVDDVDARTKQVKTAGGQVHRDPADIPGIGRFSIVADPQGAVLAMLQPAPASPQPAPAAPDTPGHAGWRELFAADWKTAFPVYADLFGWTKGEGIDMGPMGTYQLFNVGDTSVGGMMTKPAEIPAPFWHYYFNVDAIDAAAERVKTAGGTITMGPDPIPGGGWIIHVTDPQGAKFGLVAMAR